MEEPTVPVAVLRQASSLLHIILLSLNNRDFLSGAYSGIEVRYASGQEGRRP